MKKRAILFAVLAMSGVALNAEQAVQKNQVVVKAEGVALSADEQAFLAKLNNQNRTSFAGFSPEQRKAILVAVQHGANGDEAVEHMVAAQELKGAAIVDAAAPQGEEVAQ